MTLSIQSAQFICSPIPNHGHFTNSMLTNFARYNIIIVRVILEYLNTSHQHLPCGYSHGYPAHCEDSQ